MSEVKIQNETKSINARESCEISGLSRVLGNLKQFQFVKASATKNNEFQGRRLLAYDQQIFFLSHLKDIRRLSILGSVRIRAGPANYENSN